MFCSRTLSSISKRNLLCLRLRSVSTFNSQRKALQRNRAAKLPNHHQFDYLKDGIAEILADRITDISRDFPKIVDLGAGKGHVYKHVNTYTTNTVVECDTAQECLNLPRQNIEGLKTEQILLESDDTLPFENSSQDLIISNLWLHWVNELPKLFREVERVLTPDGVFIGSMFAAETVYQLRVSLQQAELERTGGIAPHISPFVTPADLGSLLTGARFCMITLDSEDITITYPDLYFLMRDIQGMAENGCLTSSPGGLRRDVLMGAAGLYHDLYANADNSLPLAFNVLYFIAWKQSAAQGKPKPRGSQNASIGDLGKMFDQGPKTCE
ncbi:arginine-hydroxylase NDUFAF5, mitochondrial-like [Bolinopsis microptera]|uniref:arginine-hydroxylase NDUFAF5, mitochondrial-like n=1 Tax=Bolinopsis microptera TaxID=2820187 RepID=UPI0030799D33